METKYIIVTGGVLSGLGKGIATASIGHLLSYDYKVVPIKCDGYLNVDPGTMNPVEHGEVFVLDDGTEVDMDFGHYERFLRVSCTGRQNLTMGKVFHEIYEKERNGDYLGKTVQLIPHGAEHIIQWWKQEATKQDAEIVLIEIGGTIGDMENELYIEAGRRLRQELGKQNVLFVHLSYVPVPGGVHEQKSKPTQQSVSLLMQRGILPDIILCRCQEAITDVIKKKISSFCNVEAQAVINAVDVESVYEIPLLFYEDGLLHVVNEQLRINAKPDLTKWKQLIAQQKKPSQTLSVAICGKYTALEDSYASVVEALRHAGIAHTVAIDVTWVDTEAIEQGVHRIEDQLKQCHAVIVPGGFGSRGIEGKISVIEYCRTQNIPYLGICYGLQLAVIEFMRNIVGKKDAHTTEVHPETSTPVITILPDKKYVEQMGGTLRLGSYKAVLDTQSLIASLYAGTEVSERHRHRYEVDPVYMEELENAGLTISGVSPDGLLVEFIELRDHPYFVATQAHPELKSSLLCPAPLFMGLIQAGKNRKI